MQDQSSPTPTGNHESNGAPKSKIAKYRSMRVGELRSSVRRSLRGMPGLTQQPSTGMHTLAGLRLRGSLGSVMRYLRQARILQGRPL